MATDAWPAGGEGIGMQMLGGSARGGGSRAALRSVPLAALAAALLFGAPAVDAAETLYRWVDESGRVTYSQQPPPARARKPETLRFNDARPDAAELPYAAKRAAESFPVKLYTASGCAEPCTAARDLLDKRGVPFKEESIGDAAGAESLKALTGKTGVPVLTVGRETLSSFDAAAWNRALDLAGYPSSIAARPRARSAPGERPAVQLYASASCGLYCDEARRLLAQRGVAFREIAVEDEASFAELRKLSREGTLPTLVVGTSSIAGYNAQRYSDALDAAGFPGTASARQ